MTLQQIQTLLDKLEHAASRIDSELAEINELDSASVDELHKLGRRAAEIASRIEAIKEAIEKRSEAQTAMVDSADSLASDLRSISEQLMAFEEE